MKIKDKVCKEFGWRDYDHFDCNEDYMEKPLYEVVQALILARLECHYLKIRLEKEKD